MATETVQVSFTPAEIFDLCKHEFDENDHAILNQELHARFPGGITSRLVLHFAAKRPE